MWLGIFVVCNFSWLEIVDILFTIMDLIMQWDILNNKLTKIVEPLKINSRKGKYAWVYLIFLILYTCLVYLNGLFLLNTFLFI